MNISIVSSIIRRSNRKLLARSIVGFLLLIGFASLNASYLYNFCFGPFTFDRQTLLEGNDTRIPWKSWGTITGDDVAGIGPFGPALLIDDRILLIDGLGSSIMTTTTFTGHLTRLPARWKNQASNYEVTLHFSKASDGVSFRKDAFLPYILRANNPNNLNFRTFGYIGLSIGVPLLVICIWMLGQAIIRCKDASAHPIMRKLSRFGPAHDIAEQIDAEIKNDQQQVNSPHFMPSWLVPDSTLHLTSNWLVLIKVTHLTATRFDDVVWAYKDISRRHRNGKLIVTYYFAQIFDRHGVRITFWSSETVVDQVLAMVAHRAPWLIAGYSPELKKAWQRDRKMLIKAVDQRRQ